MILAFVALSPQAVSSPVFMHVKLKKYHKYHTKYFIITYFNGEFDSEFGRFGNRFI